MESKHTPGPWVAKTDAYIITARSNEGLILGGTSELEARLHYNGNLIAETVAPCNRYLIAAAPDMYDTLLLVKKYLDGLQIYGSVNMARLVNATLATATGNNPVEAIGTTPHPETKNQQ